MRVLMVAHAFPPVVGGVETHLADVSHELALRGHRVLCLVGGERGDPETPGGVGVARRPELRVADLVAARAGLAADAISHPLLASLDRIAADALGGFRPDVVHLHNAHHFAPELALAFFRRRAHPPLVNTVHDHVGNHLYPGVLAYGWSRVIYVSRHAQAAMPSPAERATVLWPGIELRGFAAARPPDPRLAALERPVVFHPARLLRWKGAHVGVAAFARLRAELGAGTLVLAASANVTDDRAEVARYRGELEEAAAAAGVGRHVRFLPFERARIASAYRASDLVWYPTIDEEPFGLAPLEAMACGVPVVAADSGGMRETLVHGESGLVVPRSDPASLAAAARAVLTDAALRDRLVAGGRRRLEAFRMDGVADRLETIYASACGAG